MENKKYTEEQLYTLGKEIKNMKSILKPAMERIENLSMEEPEKKRSLFSQLFALKMPQLVKVAFVPASAFIVLLVIGFIFFPSPMKARQVLLQSQDAMEEVNSFYMEMAVRTSPFNNFESIELDGDFNSNRIWAVFNEAGLDKYRVEKAGRVAAVNEQGAVMVVKNQGISFVMEGAKDSGFVEDFRRLFDIKNILHNESEYARQNRSNITVTTEEAGDRRMKIILEIEGKAKTSDNDTGWMRNKSITTSDHKRKYVIDKESMLLEYYEMSVKVAGEEVVVLKTRSIIYNHPIDDSLFTLEIPENAIRDYKGRSVPAYYTQLSPVETAKAFFLAVEQENWEEVMLFLYTSNLPDEFKHYYKELEVLSIGQAFQSGDYEGYFVPYEIRFADGTVKKHNLALKKDRKLECYIIDGGL